MFFIKETKIFKRLKGLWLYTRLFDLDTSRTHVLERNNEDVSYSENILIEFKSNLGTVRISIVYRDEDNIYLSYSNYAGSTVFKILAYDTYTPMIEPMLGEDLTASDIDLALLEVETYLQDTYGDIEVLWKEHLEYEKYKRKLHMQQVKELE